MITLYDLAGDDDRRFSPNTWRSRLALEQKGLAYETVGLGFLEIGNVLGGQYKQVPIIKVGDTEVLGSDKIADYLEETYPDQPSIYGTWGHEAIRFFEAWTANNVMAPLAPMIVADIFRHIKPEDKEYFRSSREKRFGMTLEDLEANREAALPVFTKSLHPARMILRSGGYLGGETPNYADFLLVSQFQWARCCTEFRVLADDDLLWDWFQRMLDQFDGVLRKEPSYWG